MPFTFMLDKPDNITHTYEQLKTQVQQAGGIFEGDTTGGSISIEGIEGKYKVLERGIEIIITKSSTKLLPNWLIEKKIRKLTQPFIK